MNKIPTLFKRDPEGPRHVLDEVTPGCEWVLEGRGRPTRKFDGTCVMLDRWGDWWARRVVKPGKVPPPGFDGIATDEVTGNRIGWEPIAQSPFSKFHAEAIDGLGELPPGTYELYGPKINGNPEGAPQHRLTPHGAVNLTDFPRTFAVIKDVLSADYPYEGIVWWHPDGRKAKIKRRDFV